MLTVVVIIITTTIIIFFIFSVTRYTCGECGETGCAIVPCPCKKAALEAEAAAAEAERVAEKKRQVWATPISLSVNLNILPTYLRSFIPHIRSFTR